MVNHPMTPIQHALAALRAANPQYGAQITEADLAAAIAVWDAEQWRPIGEARPATVALVIGGLAGRPYPVTAKALRTKDGWVVLPAENVDNPWRIDPTHFRPLPAPPKDEAP